MATITEDFIDPRGQLVNYETANLDLNDALKARAHRNIRSFSSEAPSRPKIIYDISIAMSVLDPQTMADLEGTFEGPKETWTVGTSGPDPAYAGRPTLRVPIATGTVTTTSVGTPVNLFIKTGDEISVALPNFPVANLNLSTTFLRFKQGTNVVSLKFSDSLNPFTVNSEAKWPATALGTITAPDTVELEFAATGSATVTVAGIRVLAPGWTATKLDINTIYQRLQPTAARNGLTPTTPFPKVWRMGDNGEDFLPINTKLGINLYTGAMTQANSMTLFFRGRREDFITQLDIDGVLNAGGALIGGTDQAALDSYGVQPDYGRAVYNPHPQTDYDAMPQTTLDTFSQFEMERQPDLISEAWVALTISWGLVNQMHFATTETTTSSSVTMNIPFQAQTPYLLVVELVDNSIRLLAYPLDPLGLVMQTNAFSFDSQAIVSDFIINRRKGRVGWIADINDGDSHISAIRSRGLMFNEYISQNFESFTPVEGARISVGATNDVMTQLGLAPQGESTVTINRANARSSDGALEVNCPFALTGLKSSPFTFEDFENTEIQFDLYYFSGQTQPEIYLTNDQGLYIALRMPGLLTNKWNKVTVQPLASYLEQTGIYYILIAPPTGTSRFLIDNFGILQRAVRWSGRSTLYDATTQAWTEFRSLINDQNNGIMFPKRDRFLQIRGQAVMDHATIDRVYIRPKYAELGRQIGTDSVTSIPALHSPHTVRLAATPVGSTPTIIVGGTTYTFPQTPHHAINTELTFTATVFSNLSAAIEEYYWDFGDGVEASTTTNTVQHTYKVANMGTVARVRTRTGNEEAWASLNMMLE